MDYTQPLNTATSDMNMKAKADNYLVVIDSGHGWGTLGKQSLDGTLRENEFNSSVEAKLCYLLQRLGICYVQTAPEWWDTGLSERVKKEAAYIASNKNKQVIGISIHANAFKDTNVSGIETFFGTGKTESQLFAKAVHKAIVEKNTKRYTITKDRGVKEADYYILKNTKGVWCLVELGFMTNQNDLSYLKSDAYRNDCADALMDGILTYIKLKTA